MKKRILSCLMALALCLTLLPTAALAAGGHTHCICGKSGCTVAGHEEIAFSKWLTSGYGIKGALTLYYDEADKTSGYSVSQESQDGGNWLLDGGNYYLRTDVDNYKYFSEVKINHTIVITGNVTICLNGQTLESIGENMPVFRVKAGGTLTLTDCQGNPGKVKHTGDGSGSGVEVEGGGTFNMYGGTITGNKASHGGGVYVYGGTFNMHGGTITKNTANHGGGVYVEGGKFTILSARAQPQVCPGAQSSHRVQPTGSDGCERFPFVPLAFGCHGLQLHSGGLNAKNNCGIVK